MKNKVILGIIIINIILTYIIILNNYKHYKANVEDNNINYNYNNLAIYQKKDTEACKTSTDDSCYEEVTILPNGKEYIINQEKSVCYLNNDDKHYNRVYTNQNGEHVVQNMLKGEKCYIYFDKVEKHEMNVTILAKLGSDTINFPTKGTKNPKSITCTNDVSAKFDFNNWEVEVDALENTDITCTVEFEEFTSQSFNTYLTNNAKTLGLVEENGLRYEGADVDVHNYVLFNDELWRIIGVFDVETASGTQNLVKLIRANVLDGLVWSSYDLDMWENGSLQKSLNSGYLSKQSELCVYSEDYYGGIEYKYTKTCNFSETGLGEAAREKIEAVRWNIGKSIYNATAETIHTNEITTQTTGYYKVGLMSASDYGYAVKSNSCGRETTLGEYEISDCAGQNWLLGTYNEWTITPSGNEEQGALDVRLSGRVYGFDGIGLSLVLRPSIYLKSNVELIGGFGKYSNPYIIN